LKGREGLGHELVRALKPGDRVAIVALAEVRVFSIDLVLSDLSFDSNGAGRTMLKVVR
jgi:hypothetical protein